MKWEAVIGLEIHIELATNSKMFCACSADYFRKEPNSHVCPVCLGLPGAMPVANNKAIEFTQLIGLALDCKLPLSSKFDRKNYFYPDLTKGFQISQYDLPFSENGKIQIEIGGKTKVIGITRAHLEEDTGKLLHTKINGKKVTLIDFNRSGVPLIEIVSEPDMTSSEEAKHYAQNIQQIIRYLKTSDADMEKGSMRIEPNVSLRKKNQKALPNYKVELKNINSFKFAKNAIDFEIERQAKILNNGRTPVQETRGWNEYKNETVSQRSKEEAHDYRYFPEPDLPPFIFSKNAQKKLLKALPELPGEKLHRFIKVYNLNDYDSKLLTKSDKVSDFFEKAVEDAKSSKITPKMLANEIINKKVNPDNLLPSEFVQNTIKTTTTVNVSQDELEKAVDQILNENSKAAQDFKQGKENALMFLLGQVMKKIAKKVDIEKVKIVLINKLK